MTRSNRWLFATVCTAASAMVAWAPGTLAQALTHIQTIHTSTAPVASPDVSGIFYLEDSGTLLTVDSEVNETPLFVGANAFEYDLDGLQLDTFGITGITGEPTGLTYDAVTGTLFVSDDNRQDIYAIGAGPNGDFDGFPADGGDDVLISRVRTDDFGNLDPEGLTFSPVERVLYMAGGAQDRVYRISPGGNGLFDGVPPLGDDSVTWFDTTAFGLTDPEGISYDPDSGHLYMVGRPRRTIFHVTVNGFLVRSFQVPVVTPERPSGITMAPSTLGASDPNPTVMNLFIADRGIDNNVVGHSDENDGRIFEFSVPDLGFIPNFPPIVNAGVDQTIPLGDSATLDGSVADDGIPEPPGALTTLWSVDSGPGVVTFGDAFAIDTTASFSAPGLYLLRLEADDGSLTTADVMQVAVQPPPPALSAVYLSTGGSALLGGEKAKDEDIWRFDFGAGTWTQFFDGSDVGLGASGVDIDAFHINADGSLLISLHKPAVIPGVGAVDDSDIVRFVPTQTGPTTAGTFEWYLDGSDVGLQASSEDISAIAFAPDGRLLVSTTGYTLVDGVLYRDEDLMAFTATSLGIDSAGTFDLYFDGSDVGLSDGRSDEEVYAAWVEPGGKIYLSTRGNFAVPGVSGPPVDIFTCDPTSLGITTTCLYQRVFEGAFYELAGEQIDAMFIQP